VLDSGNLESDLHIMDIIEDNLFKGAPRNTVVITDIKDVSILAKFTKFTQNSLNVHQIPKSGYLSALLSVIPLQRIAYDLTIERGYDPDRPRNLAKELTTK
jgi:glucosamine 6-phosphate synthetase-like amidotransferase/phosphosugar isomerase protein